MFAHRLAELFPIIMHGGVADNGLFDQRRERCGQPWRVGRVDNNPVERTVTVEKRADIGPLADYGRSDRRVRRNQRIKARPIESHRRPCGRMPFEHATQEKHFVDIVVAPVGHERALRIRPDDIKFSL